MSYEKGMMVDSTIGLLSTDTNGSPVAGAKMDAALSYVGIPELLRNFINESDATAWEKIKGKVDYTYTNLDHTLSSLNEETGFGESIRAQVKAGKKLFFKPNLVNPGVIDPVTHGEGLGNSACTGWPFIAALMRWFHDKLDISYHEMAIGEAASATSLMAGTLRLEYDSARTITTEALIEGRCGDFYGGWGFYFVRKYLSETHDTSHEDNPMNGYEESVSGEYFPPGRAGNRLLVYDLNRLYDVKSKGREVAVPDGANYKEITLHKAIIGGDPDNHEDIKDYPGCVLVNVPKLKVHSIDLLTNAIKNLGIGLYPMEVARDDDPKSTRWKYASAFKPFPVLKSEIPHQVWLPKMDDETGLPVKDKNGQYIVTKTAGIPGTMVDVIRATENQQVLMLHVVDAIEATNIDHQGMGTGVKVSEGYIFASLDPVALDLLCARYMFKTVPVLEARRLQKEKNLLTDFIQRVPIPKSDGQNIVTEEGFDAPLSRHNLFKYAESRGLGQQSYYVVGWDGVAEAPLASLEGHLGRVEGGKFAELITDQLYHAPSKLLWDLQNTVLSYIKANDSLTGSAYLQELMATFDENGDGVIDYDEMGKTGFYTPMMRLMAETIRLRAVDEHEFLRGQFISRSGGLKYTNEKWNSLGHNFLKEVRLSSACTIAFMMSQLEMEGQDPIFPTITWGKGKWPSFQFATAASIGFSIYGMGFPMRIDLMSLYGHAFQYADKTLNGGSYTGITGLDNNLEAANQYIKAVSDGAAPLDFLVYVPTGYGSLAGTSVPNVEETEDPDKIFTARFNNGQEVW